MNFCGNSRLLIPCLTNLLRWQTKPGLNTFLGVIQLPKNAVTILKRHLDLDCFSRRPPQSCFVDLSLYSGDFPRPGMENSIPLLHRACGYEVYSRFGNGPPDPERFRDLVANLPEAPPWLTTNNQAQVFRRLMDEGEISGAWLSLNSPGWSFSDARNSIQMLSKRVADPTFAILADAWCSLRHESKMGNNF